MLKVIIAAVLAVATLYIAYPASAQMYGLETDAHVGIGIGAIRPNRPYGWDNPGYADEYQARTRRIRVEHPFNTPGQYRCNADGRPATPGTGWCRH